MSRSKKFIPNSLRKFRRLAGLSQADVSRQLGLKSTGMISRWEKGLIMPNAENLLKLSILYKTLVNELYYALSKELQALLFPEEMEIIRQTKEKSKTRTDCGP